MLPAGIDGPCPGFDRGGRGSRGSGDPEPAAGDRGGKSGEDQNDDRRDRATVQPSRRRKRRDDPHRGARKLLDALDRPCAGDAGRPRSGPRRHRPARPLPEALTDRDAGGPQPDRQQPPVDQDRRKRSSRDEGRNRPWQGETRDRHTGIPGRGTGPADAGDRNDDEAAGQERRTARPARQIGDATGAEAAVDRDDPRCERAPRDDEDQQPGPCRRPDRGIEDRKREDDEPRIGDDRVADDMLEIVLDPGREQPEDNARRADGDDHCPLGREWYQERGDRPIDPQEGDRGERGRTPGHEEGQGDAGCRIRDAGGPQVERNRAEPDRHGRRDREVRDPEQPRSRDKPAERSGEPCDRDDREGRGDRQRTELPCADIRGRRSRADRCGDENPDQTARRGRDDGDARIDRGKREDRGREPQDDHPRHVRLMERGHVDEDETHPDDGAEDREQPQPL